jgi:hypothetical protein
LGTFTWYDKDEDRIFSIPGFWLNGPNFLSGFTMEPSLWDQLFEMVQRKSIEI